MVYNYEIGLVEAKLELKFIRCIKGELEVQMCIMINKMDPMVF